MGVVIVLLLLVSLLAAELVPAAQPTPAITFPPDTAPPTAVGPPVNFPDVAAVVFTSDAFFSASVSITKNQLCVGVHVGQGGGFRCGSVPTSGLTLAPNITGPDVSTKFPIVDGWASSATTRVDVVYDQVTFRIATKAVPGIPGRVFAEMVLPDHIRGFVAYDRTGRILQKVAN